MQCHLKTQIGLISSSLMCSLGFLFLWAIGPRASVSSRLLSRGYSQFFAIMSLPLARSQHGNFIKANKGESLLEKTEVTILCDVTVEVTFHQCSVLLVRDKPQVLPILMSRGLQTDMTTQKKLRWQHQRTVCSIQQLKNIETLKVPETSHCPKLFLPSSTKTD